MRSPTAHALAAALLLALGAAPARANTTTAAPLVALAPPPPAASGAAGSIDPAAATRAYLDRLSPEERRRSDAYFEGGYWLQLWDWLWGAAVSLVLLATGLSARMRDAAERRVRARPLQVALYWAMFAVVSAVLGFPLAFYEGHVREHAYGLSNLSFGAWLGEQGKALALTVVFGAAGVAALYAVLRRAPRTWWAWGAGVAVALLAFVVVVTPIAIVPLFNAPKPLADERVRAPILSLARASGIDARDVWEVDASRQSKRISANVSGFLGTQRITLNDNLLARASLPEIRAVMAHEMGHYVLNHVYKHLLQLGLVFTLGFAVAARVFERLRARYPSWRVRGVDDPAGLPLLALVLTTWLFVLTPVVNTMIRAGEQEADWYGLQAAGEPDGFAQVALKLAEYRKLEPGPLEEVLFYDHPSGRTRILTAMRWKAEHPETWTRAPAPRAAGPGASAPAAARP